MTKRMNITVTDTLYASLEDKAKKEGVPMVSIIRFALREHLEKFGYEVDIAVNWGGDRRPNQQPPVSLASGGWVPSLLSPPAET